MIKSMRKFLIVSVIVFLSAMVGGAVAQKVEEAPDALAKQVDAILKRMDVRNASDMWDVELQLEGLGEGIVGIIEERISALPPVVQLGCAKALCAYGRGDEAVLVMASIIRRHQNRDVSVPAAKLMGLCNAADAENEILRLLKETNDPYVKMALCVALKTTSKNEASIRLALGTMYELLNSGDEKIKVQCVLALAGMGDIKPLNELVKGIMYEPTQRGELARAIVRRNEIAAEYGDNKRNWSGRIGERLLDELIGKIGDYYVEEEGTERDKLISAAAKGMVRALDRYSAYMDDEDWSKFQEEMKGSYGGIGAYVGFRDEKFVIITPIYSGPAYRKNIRSGDHIVEVDGVPTHGKPIGEIVSMLKGTPGTDVTLTVHRRGWSKANKIVVTREKITIEPIQYTLLPGKIGYVRLTGFNDDVSDKMDVALNELEKNGMRALIFDLRNNPGGLLHEAVNVSDLFLEGERLIVSSKGRNPKIAPDRPFYTRDKGTHPQYPMVVLVNGGSASASEIVAGAMRDHNRAVLIGDKTFGKGSVQQLMPLRATAGRSTLRLTIAKYYLPDGDSIHEKGIEPDIEVKFPEVDAWVFEEMEKIHNAGAIEEYLDKHYPENKELFAGLAENDEGDFAKYPDFEAFYVGLNSKLSRDRVRQTLRSIVKRRVADDRGEPFIIDIEEDIQLQRAVVELCGKLAVPVKSIPEYTFIGDKFEVTQDPSEPTAANPGKEVLLPK